jgi:ATP-binding cassette, subfamily B, bacterial
MERLPRRGSCPTPEDGVNAMQSYFPIGVAPRHAPARAGVDPDRSKKWMRRALPLVLSHRWMFGSALFATAVAMTIQAVIPRIMMAGIDKGLDVRESGLMPYVLAIVGLAAVRGISNFVGRYLLFKTAYALEYDFRTIVYEHLSRLPFGFYDRVQSGQLISRANSDIRSVQLYLTFAPMIILQCFSALLALGIMLTVNVRLALVAMAAMPFVFLLGVKLRTRIFPISWVVQARAAEVATVVDETVNGIRVVKSFAAERRQLSLLERAARRVQWATVRDIDIRARFAPVIENLPRIGLALILLYGGYLTIHGRATVGTVVAFTAYVLQLQAPFRTVGTLMMMGQRARASAGRVYELLDEPVAITDRDDAVDLVNTRGEVEFKDVAFHYGPGQPVLDGLDLILRAGETVALVGVTASGKSTIARLIPRFYDVSSGAVLVDGYDVRELSLGSLRASIAFVSDEPFLFSVSIRDNIAYGRPDASREEVEAAAHAAAAHDFVAALPNGYDTVIGERGYTLSGGQRQRIALARALLVNPRILILDDATSAIDVQVEQQIHRALRTLLRTHTTLLIAHRLATISLADRVVVLDGGRILAEGTHAELLASEPRYAEILAQLIAEDDAVDLEDEPGADVQEHVAIGEPDIPELELGPTSR